MSQTESKDLLRNIFSSSSDGIACSDLKGNILFANKSFTEILGYSSDELKEKNIHQLLIDENSFNKLVLNGESYAKFYDKKFVIRSGEVSTFPVKFWRQQNGLADGTIWMIIKNIKETKSNGASPGINNIDGSRLLKITLSLQEQFKIISSSLKNLKQDLGGELEGIDDYISFASESCNKAKSLIDELSEYSGIKQINNNLRIICKEQIDLSGQVN